MKKLHEALYRVENLRAWSNCGYYESSPEAKVLARAVRVLAKLAGLRARRNDSLQAELNKLKDPAAVWANMLAGTIARPQALEHYEECKAEVERLGRRAPRGGKNLGWTVRPDFIEHIQSTMNQEYRIGWEEIEAVILAYDAAIASPVAPQAERLTPIGKTVEETVRLYCKDNPDAPAWTVLPVIDGFEEPNETDMELARELIAKRGFSTPQAEPASTVDTASSLLLDKVESASERTCEGIDEIDCIACTEMPHVDHIECARCHARLYVKIDDYYCHRCGSKLRDQNTGKVIIHKSSLLHMQPRQSAGEGE